MRGLLMMIFAAAVAAGAVGTVAAAVVYHADLMLPVIIFICGACFGMALDRLRR